MAEIGRPREINKKFSNIAMTKKPSITQNIDKLRGNGEGVKFVDRKNHNKMGKTEFLKLLTYQLTNQDPMNPMDQKKFSGELAQFAQLEQMTEMNKAIANQAKNQPSEAKFYAASFLGKQVTTYGTTLDYDGVSSGVELPFFLPKSAKNVMIRIFDSHGQMIGQIDKEAMGRGSQTVRWDGKSLDGTRATKDTYTIHVRGWDQDYNEFKGETRAVGTVTGVSFENGETVLELNRKKSVFLRDVETFKLIKDNKINKRPVLKKNADLAYRSNTEQVL